MNTQTNERPEDFDPSACRRLLAAVVTLAVDDLTNAPTEADRVSAVNFFWGPNPVADHYLLLLGLDVGRFKNALKAKLDSGVNPFELVNAKV